MIKYTIKFFLFIVSLPLFAQKYNPIPTQSQLDALVTDSYLFVHFEPNTFNNMEWGFGNEHLDNFNPNNFDYIQWAKTAIQAGTKEIIIKAKHYEGFCLWPILFSIYTLKESSWKNGKGDALKVLSDIKEDIAKGEVFLFEERKLKKNNTLYHYWTLGNLNFFNRKSRQIYSFQKTIQF